MIAPTIPSEEVVRWRQSVGGTLNGIWRASPESRSNQLLVIFGHYGDERALETPLAMSVRREQEHDSNLWLEAKELWDQPWGTVDPGIADVAPGGPVALRIVMVTSVPVSRQLLRELLTKCEQLAN